MEKSVRAKIILSLDGGKKSVRELSQETGASIKTVARSLDRLRMTEIVKVSDERSPTSVNTPLWDLNRED